MSLKTDAYYETMISSTIKCGACWQKDIDATKADKLVGDEAVYEHELMELPDVDAYQCDECLKQSENYDDYSSDGF